MEAETAETPLTMSSNIIHTVQSGVRRLAVALAVPACAVLAPSAHAQQAEPELRSAPIGVSVGIGAGFAPAHRACAGASTDSCDRISFGNKVWVGYDITNDVTAQVSYLYFNGVNRDFTNADNATVARTRVQSRAWAVGFDWHIDLLHTVTNHLRAGVGRMETRYDNILRAGGSSQVNDFKIAPYVGAGLSMPLNEYVSFDASFDYFFAGSQSRHLLYIGTSGRF